MDIYGSEETRKSNGTDFELQVFDEVARALQAEELGLRPESCKIYHHKSYYSKDRKADVITDISIEIYLPNAVMPHIIWIWECKDYAEPVPVRVVEAFDSLLNQIGAHNTKGTLVSKNGFQAAALCLAVSKGIGLYRFHKGLANIAALDGPPWDVIDDFLGDPATPRLMLLDERQRAWEFIDMWLGLQYASMDLAGHSRIHMTCPHLLKSDLEHLGVLPSSQNLDEIRSRIAEFPDLEGRPDLEQYKHLRLLWSY